MLKDWWVKLFDWQVLEIKPIWLREVTRNEDRGVAISCMNSGAVRKWK